MKVLAREPFSLKIPFHNVSVIQPASSRASRLGHRRSQSVYNSEVSRQKGQWDTYTRHDLR